MGTAHRDQAQAIRAILTAGGLPGITVDTANRLQGREFDIVIVRHPLSGRRELAGEDVVELGEQLALTALDFA